MSEIRTYLNDHGVVCCDRTERTDAPLAVTRIRFGEREGYFCPGTLLMATRVRPFYRPLNAFGFSDEGRTA